MQHLVPEALRLLEVREVSCLRERGPVGVRQVGEDRALVGLPVRPVRFAPHDERRLTHRPVAVVASILVVISMGVLTWKGATAKEALASEVIQDVPRWVADERLPANAQPGAKLFASAGCTACHTYDGSGGSNLGAPDLTSIGTRNLGIQFQINHLKCPSCVTPGSPMPKFASLGDARLRQLAIFLEASKGKQ